MPTFKRSTTNNFSKKIHIFGILLFLCFSDCLLAEQFPNVSGYFITRKGKTITFTRVTEYTKSLTFMYGPEDKKTKVPLKRIKEITFGENCYIGLVKFKDGKAIQAKAYGANWFGNDPWFKYSYYDEIEQKERESNLRVDDIAKVIFDNVFGQFKKCPHCNGIWPDDYIFCPHDGTRTKWGGLTNQKK